MSRCSNSHCDGISPALQVCGGCGTARYCCRECQVADWKAGHKGQCWGTKFGAMAQAIEIGLFGKNLGGKPREQIACINAVLEQKSVALASAEGESDQTHLQNLLMYLYMPSIVQISNRSFAVFTPGVFNGVHPSREKALRAVTLQYSALQSDNAPTTCAPHEYMHPMIEGGQLPRMNWIEFALMAVLCCLCKYQQYIIDI
jgi:hypothetical protein